jgi:maltose alpha-D-glucosyltransferase/alpha-amylase
MAVKTTRQNGYSLTPLWYKDAIIYEAHVKTFQDGNGDGIGDFVGLTQRLDYLQSIGITAIWLLPFYPSPLRDDGYDIADYMTVHPDYGNLQDFKNFLKEAHKRGLQVITELVINHTSDQHQWFQRARQSRKGSANRNFYVWSDSPNKYTEARIIFKDFESSNWTFDPVANAYYWHRFYHHQPDLNFENNSVQKAIFHVLDFWLGLGVDGLRLDAVPYLFEEEGSICENLPKTHEFLKKLRKYVEKNYPNRMLLAEANQWPEDAVEYFGQSDECHMCFHFPLMPRMFMAIQMEDRFPIIDILDQTPDIPDDCQWASFLRNHDELTLEMVTDEERDYMYKVYATDTKARINLGIRRRLAPLLGNDRRQIELMNIMLFSLPGTPVLYYGDEIGMGDNYYLGDRNGVRTPMQWNGDRNGGFSRANPQQLLLPVIIDPEYHYEAVNVEVQSRNTNSLLWWMRRLISTTKRFKALSRGSVEFVYPENPKVLAFIRSYEDEKLLVVINLSKYSQPVELDLSDYSGHIPEEVFSQNHFPIIEKKPYVITCGGFGYYWFLLKEERRQAYVEDSGVVPELELENNWMDIFNKENQDFVLTRIFAPYIKKCRWYGSKAMSVRRISIVEQMKFPRGMEGAILLVKLSFRDAQPETYQFPVSYTTDSRAIDIRSNASKSVIANLTIGQTQGVLYDALYDPEFQLLLLNMVYRKKLLKGRNGNVVGIAGKKLRTIYRSHEGEWNSNIMRAEQSNSSVLYEDKLILKLYRKVTDGVNPDPEISRVLTEKTKFTNIPTFAGTLEYHCEKMEPYVLGMLQTYEPNQGDAWKLSLDFVTRYFEEAISRVSEKIEPPYVDSSVLNWTPEAMPEILKDMVGGIYMEMVALLGKRTGEMHQAFASVEDDPEFRPENITSMTQRSIYQSMREQTRRTMQLIQKNLSRQPEHLKSQAEDVLSMEPKILKLYQRMIKHKMAATRIRIHGDYHLAQVLYTGKDFIILDFEGEPAKPLTERRLKRSAFRDIAGMIRSFHYAIYNVLFQNTSFEFEDKAALEPWADLLYNVLKNTFLHEYLLTVEGAGFIPKNEESLIILLEAYLLDKAIYELGYELNNRPDWIDIPIKGIRQILEEEYES